MSRVVAALGGTWLRLGCPTSTTSGRWIAQSRALMGRRCSRRWLRARAVSVAGCPSSGVANRHPAVVANIATTIRRLRRARIEIERYWCVRSRNKNSTGSRSQVSACAWACWRSLAGSCAACGCERDDHVRRQALPTEARAPETEVRAETPSARLRWHGGAADAADRRRAC